MREWPWLLAFLALVVGGGLVIGYLTAPGEWYDGLAKPAFNPPPWVFAPVWTLLYAAIAVAGWRVWRREPEGAAMWLWWTQLALNFAWSPVFFAAHRAGLALALILALFAAAFGFTAAAWRLDRPAALLFLPYLAWLLFASVLNIAILMLN
jgi:translocator protein